MCSQKVKSFFKAWNLKEPSPRLWLPRLRGCFGLLPPLIFTTIFVLSPLVTIQQMPPHVFVLTGRQIIPICLIQGSGKIWGQIWSFGGFNGPAMQCAMDGSSLPFFSTYLSPGSSRINVFVQLPAKRGDLFSNPYAFQPIVLIPRVLWFVRDQAFPCTLVIPNVRPRKFWWPLLQLFSSFLLAPQGTPDIVLPPSTQGFSPSWPLLWGLWVFLISHP